MFFSIVKAYFSTSTSLSETVPVLSFSVSGSSVSLTYSLSSVVKVLHARIIQITASEMSAEADLKIAEFVC